MESEKNRCFQALGPKEHLLTTEGMRCLQHDGMIMTKKMQDLDIAVYPRQLTS